jgi:hypothetical protein
LTRITNTLQQQKLDADDEYALAVLQGPLSRQRGHAQIVAASASSKRPKDPAQRPGPAAVSISPQTQLALNYWGVVAVKAQAAGRFNAKAHWWGDVVVGFDETHAGDRWHLVGTNIPAAVAAGVSIDAIEALFDGREEDLSEEDAQYVRFIREVIAGTVSDETWRAQVKLVGSERGVIDLLSQYLNLLVHVRVAQALGIQPEFGREDYDQMIAGLRAGDWPLTDVKAYEDFFRKIDWPRVPLAATTESAAQ